MINAIVALAIGVWAYFHGDVMLMALAFLLKINNVIFNFND